MRCNRELSLSLNCAQPCSGTPILQRIDSRNRSSMPDRLPQTTPPLYTDWFKERLPKKRQPTQQTRRKNYKRPTLRYQLTARDTAHPGSRCSFLFNITYSLFIGTLLVFSSLKIHLNTGSCQPP
ncbi:hypothetical protein NQZ68_015665 [Dissostichus eleginoides]|nr:hypothetical protein NQZ68_015665 [Dissostichus eleginoides]